MTTAEQVLSLMKVHVFESEQARARAEAQGLIGGNDLVITPDPGSVDSAMSCTSANPVENRVIKKYVDDAIAAALAGQNNILSGEES